MENSTTQILGNTDNIDKPNLWPIAIKFGMIGGVAYILIFLYNYLSGALDMDQYTNGGFSFGKIILGGLVALLIWGIYLMIYHFAVKTYREELGGFITFGEGFKVAFFSVLVKAVVVLLWGLIFTLLVHPTFAEEMLNFLGETLSQSSGGDEEMVEMMMNIYSYIYNPIGLSLQWAFGTITGGAVLSLVAAYIGKKERPA
ncbi:MAG: hypothetical protein ACI94Y_004360 [Maribacter sp.]|jgi:hypothetical protein